MPFSKRRVSQLLPQLLPLLPELEGLIDREERREALAAQCLGPEAPAGRPQQLKDLEEQLDLRLGAE